MRETVRYQFWIVAAAAVIFLTNLGATALWDMDEALYASCAREMLERGNWIVPWFNGQMFPDKPPLMFWLMISAYKLFGMTEFAARFWSAVFGIGTALVTYHLGRLLFRAEVGFWAGLIVASTLIFTVSARAATVDSALVFVSTLALFVFALGAIRAGRAAGQSVREPPGLSPGSFVPGTLVPGSWISFALMYAAIGVAVLAKGPIGLLLPVASLGLFLLVMNRSTAACDWEGDSPIFAARKLGQSPGGFSADPKPQTAGRWRAWLAALLRLFAPRNLGRAAWQLRPLTAIVVVGAVALPWYVLVGMRTDGAWLAQFLGEHNWQRAFRPFQSHSGPFFYYVFAVLIGFFPWSVFLAPSLIELVRRIRRHDPWRTGLILLSCWMGVFFVFWSTVSTKLPHYVLPMYPALALITAVFLHVWLSEPACVSRWPLQNAVITLLVVGVGILVAMPILARIYLPGEEALGLVGLIPAACGGLCLWYGRREQRRRAAAAFAVTSLAFVTALFGFAALRVDRHQNAASLVAQIRQSNPGPTQLAAYRFLKQSFIWYAEEPIARYDKPEGLRQFLETAENPCVFTSSEREAEIEKEFPGTFHVLAREPRFLHHSEVLVLARRPDAPVSRTAGRAPERRGQ